MQDVLPVVKLEKKDLSEYIGAKVKIAKVELKDSEYGKYLRISTEPVNPKYPDLVASVVFGLHQVNGVWGIGEGTKLYAFLQKMSCASQDLIGKEVIIQTRFAKDGKEYLTF